MLKFFLPIFENVINTAQCRLKIINSSHKFISNFRQIYSFSLDRSGHCMDSINRACKH